MQHKSCCERSQQKTDASCAGGLVAQFGLSLDFPLPRTDSACGHCSGNAGSSEAIQDRGADLHLRNLPIKVASDKTLTRSFHTTHPCFDAASAVVPGQVSPERAPRII